MENPTNGIELIETENQNAVEKTAKSADIDVLDVLASISNKEVFTPPETVQRMLDLFPEEYWKDPDNIWVDPVAKTGVFPREIHSRLMAGLREAISDKSKRNEHILSNMLVSIGTSDLGAKATRRTMFGAGPLHSNSMPELDMPLKLTHQDNR